jgi:competence protein ComEC
MSDRWAVVLALVVFAAALAAADGHLPRVALAAGPAAVAAGWAVGDDRGHARAALVCLGAALLAASLGQRSVAGLTSPLDTGPVRGEVTLVSDPVPDGRGGATVDVRLDGRRLRAVARASAAAALDDRLAGERVTVIGSVQRPGPYERFLRHRHIAGRLAVDTVVAWRPGGPASTAANGLRRTLAAGAEVLPERQRSLLTGLTLGDDRAQPADMTDAFRAAGLTHLLAVSGQNIAFVMVIAGPVLSRLTFGPRLVATLAVLAGFALVTRGEPSVLRASGMAAVAAAGVALGRPASTLRALAVGVAAMVLVDPLLVTSLGFRLSVLGAGGIVVGAERVERWLPGPRWLAAPLAVTLAAQAAVSPLLVATFGGVPLASLPANLLAAPAAGPVMVWGLTGGLVAGVAGAPLAQVLHLPSRVLLAWLEGVAEAAVRWPLGDLRLPHLVALTGAAALMSARAGGGAWRRPGGFRRWQFRLGVGVAVATVAVTVASVSRVGPDLVGVPLGTGAAAWRSRGATAVVVDGRAVPSALLGGLREAEVARVDLVIVGTPTRAALDAAAVLRRRWPAAAVLVPRAAADLTAAMPALGNAQTPAAGTVLEVGGLRLTAGAVSERLDVRIEIIRGPPDRGRAGEQGDVSSALVVVPSRTPSPLGRDVVSLAGTPVDLRSRVLVVAVVPAPRFGRENEVAATARAAAALGADLVDVSLEPRLLGSARHASPVPVVATAASLDAAAVAGLAGAALALVPRDVVAAASGDDLTAVGVPLAVVVADPAGVAAAVELATRVGAPVAFDSTRLRAAEALAAEALAVTDGCRLVRTADVRRARRVAEVLGAVLAARRTGSIRGARP